MPQMELSHVGRVLAYQVTVSNVGRCMCLCTRLEPVQWWVNWFHEHTILIVKIQKIKKNKKCFVMSFSLPPYFGQAERVIAGGYSYFGNTDIWNTSDAHSWQQIMLIGVEKWPFTANTLIMSGKNERKHSRKKTRSILMNDLKRQTAQFISNNAE